MSRFVRPEIVRLFLADRHRRAHQALLARKKPRAAESAARLEQEIAESAARVERAEATNDWIDVKRRLNTGEVRAKYTRMYTVAAADGTKRLDPMQTGMSLVVAYLMDWSFTDDDGKPVSISHLTQSDDPVAKADLARILDNLDPDSFGEIAAAIDEHETAQAAARAAEKKTTLTGNASLKATSDLPSAADGRSSGSVN